MTRVNEGWIVTGLPELSRAFRDLNPEAGRQLRKAMRDIAKVVVKNAKGRMDFTSRTGTAKASVKAGAGAGGAWVNFPRGRGESGHTSDGYYPWLDFGGGKVMGRGVRDQGDPSHKKWKGGFRRDTTQTGGRYIYPAIDEARQSGYIEDVSYDAIERALKHLQLASEGF